MEEKGESISFVNGKNEKFFEIPDGDAIKLISEKWRQILCSLSKN